jgi:hypothetical protein
VQRRCLRAGGGPGADVVQRPAGAVGLPEGGGVPVQLGAQGRQQVAEGDVGVGRLGERGGDPQRRRQVAADHQLALQQDRGARVAEDGDHPRRLRPGAVRRWHHRERDVDGDLVAVGVHRRQLGGASGQLALPGGQEAGVVGAVAAAEALGHEDLQRAAQDGAGLVAQQHPHVRVDVGDPARGVGDDHGVRQCGQQGRRRHRGLVVERHPLTSNPGLPPRVAHVLSATQHGVSTHRHGTGPLR